MLLATLKVMGLNFYGQVMMTIGGWKLGKYMGQIYSTNPTYYLYSQSTKKYRTYTFGFRFRWQVLYMLNHMVRGLDQTGLELQAQNVTK